MAVNDAARMIRSLQFGPDDLLQEPMKGIIGPMEDAGFGQVLGLGHDLVDLKEFGRQLAMPGTRMTSLFSQRERRQAVHRALLKHDDIATHLAVRWAGKESVLKAWSQALGPEPSPYGLDDFPWSGVEILDDGRGRPSVNLESSVEVELYDSLPMIGGQVDQVQLCWHIALSHDGPVASAVVLLCRRV